MINKIVQSLADAMQGIKDGVYEGFFHRHGKRVPCEALLYFKVSLLKYSVSDRNSRLIPKFSLHTEISV